MLILGGLLKDRLKLARSFHYMGLHPANPFVRLDCAREAGHLAEAIHEFLSADGAPAGNPIRESAGGTLFLDSITDLPAAGQRMLLELASRTAGTAAESWRGRLVVGSSVDLAAEVAAGRFDARLYDCLDKLRIELEAASA